MRSGRMDDRRCYRLYSGDQVERATSKGLAVSAVEWDEPKPEKPEPPLQDDPGVVYFAHDQASRAIKIGWSRTPKRRMKDLNIGNPNVIKILGTVPGWKDAAQALHYKFWHLRIQGEWFRECNELLGYIRDVCS